MSPINLSKVIDHTALKAEVTRSLIERLCEEAIQFSFVAICIPPCWIPLAAKKLSGSSVRIATVIGFPLGYATSRNKAAEAKEAIELGAVELDMVINIGFLKSGELKAVENDISGVVDTTKTSPGSLVNLGEDVLRKLEQDELFINYRGTDKHDNVIPLGFLSREGAEKEMRRKGELTRKVGCGEIVRHRYVIPWLEGLFAACFVLAFVIPLCSAKNQAANSAPATSVQPPKSP